ncbi:MAG: hypothetical protein ACKPBT_18095 [Microcystis aeruginosa]
MNAIENGFLKETRFLNQLFYLFCTTILNLLEIGDQRQLPYS